GGVAFTTPPVVKMLCYSPGNPPLTNKPAVIQFWQHWRGANWHSIALEQIAGLPYGIAIVVPMGVLASRLPPARREEGERPPTEFCAVFFISNVLSYINIVKNINDWPAAHKIFANGARGTSHAVAVFLQAPLFGSLPFSAWTWFTLMGIAFTAATAAVL